MIITDGGNAYRSTGTPDGKAVAGTIIGGMGEQAGRVLADDAARLPIKQVTVDRNQLIGIQFVAPVYESTVARIWKCFCRAGAAASNSHTI